MKNQAKNNSFIWEQVEKTNPKFTKEAKINGRTITTINATHQLENATKIFGPYGQGFGISEIRHEEHRVDTDILLVAHATFFYKLEDERNQFPISSSIKMLYVANNGRVIFDADAYKKIETDICTKALSKLGFNADIFKGLYDDNKYLEDVIAKFKEEEMSSILKRIQEAQSVEQLTLIYNSLGKLQTDTDFLNMLSNRKLEISIK